MLDGQTIKDTLTVISTEGLAIESVDASDICGGGEQVVLTSNLSTGITWFPINDIDATTANTITVSPSANQYYVVSNDEIQGTCATADSMYIDVESNTVGDTSVFGDYEWKEYFYGNESQNYEYYYGVATFGDSSEASFDSEDFWTVDEDPSLSTVVNYYAGCSNNGPNTGFNNAYNVVYKRKGFECNRYQLDIYNDAAGEIYVDGELVASNSVFNVLFEAAWTGVLREDSEVEVRLTNLAGDGSMAVDFIPLGITEQESIKLITSPSVDEYFICTGGSELEITTRGENYHWNVVAGTNNIDRFSANNDTAYYISPSSGQADTVTYMVTIDGCEGSDFDFIDSIKVISSDSALTSIVNLDGDSACVTGATSLGEVSLQATGANSYIWSSDQPLSSTSGSEITASPNSATYYKVEGTIAGNSCVHDNPTEDSVFINVFDIADGTPGDTSLFGDNEWVAYFFDSPDYQDYYGYYDVFSPTSALFGFQSSNDFLTRENPSKNLNNQYFGCTSTEEDYYSIVFKRKGFPCGYYQISLDLLNWTNRDNLLTEVFLDGALILSTADHGTFVATENYYLTDESEIVVKSQEGETTFRVGLTLTEVGIGNVALAALNDGSGDISVWHGQANPTDNDWDNPANWCYGEVPDASTDAYIIQTGVGVTDYPILNALTPAVRTLYNNGTIDLTTGGGITIYGDLENEGVFTVTGGEVIFEGTVDATLSGNEITFENLTLNKTEADDRLTLETTIKIAGELDLTQGQLHTTTTEKLIIEDNATISNASTNSYVSGPLTKVGDDDFEFPVGKDGIYAPMTLTSSTDATTDTVSVAYNYEDPTTLSANHTNFQDDIARVSIVEYWDIDFGTNADTNYTVTLTWDDTQRESGINATDVLDMAYYNEDSLKWVFLEATVEGSSSISNGSIQADAGQIITQAGQVSFATTEESEILNPLPVTFVRFSAEIVNNIPNLLWITASEINNAYFVIEGSSDAIHFDSLGYLDGAGRSIENLVYHYADYQYQTGENYYYRIRQVDFDGGTTVSKIVSISTNSRTVEATTTEIQVYPVPFQAGEELTIQYPSESTHSIYSLRLYNQQGEELLFQSINAKEVQIEQLKYLPNGLYFLQLETSEGMQQAKLVKN